MTDAKRISEIRAGAANARSKGHKHQMLDDMDYLLTVIDAQAKEIARLEEIESEFNALVRIP